MPHPTKKLRRELTVKNLLQVKNVKKTTTLLLNTDKQSIQSIRFMANNETCSMHRSRSLDCFLLYVAEMSTDILKNQRNRKLERDNCNATAEWCNGCKKIKANTMQHFSSLWGMGCLMTESLILSTPLQSHEQGFLVTTHLLQPD